MTLNSILLVGCGNMGGAMLAGLAGGRARAGALHRRRPAPRELAGGRDAALDAIPRRRLRRDPARREAAVARRGRAAGRAAGRAGTPCCSRSSPGSSWRRSRSTSRAPAGIVRIMPNLAAAIGKSPIALAARGLDEAGRRRAFGADGAARHARMARRGASSTWSPRSPARARRSSTASSMRWPRARPRSACPRTRRSGWRWRWSRAPRARRRLAARSGRARAPRRQPRRDDPGRARRARRRRCAAPAGRGDLARGARPQRRNGRRGAAAKVNRDTRSGFA